MDTRDQAIALLATGISTSQVAAACGVTDSYISQLKADPSAQAKILELQASQTIEDKRFDTALERAESLALDKIEKSLPFANIRQAIEAFRVLNTAKKRNDSVLPPPSLQGITVNLTLPATNVINYVVNNKNEIVEVAGAPMITANARALDELIAQKTADTSLKTLGKTSQSENERGAALLYRLRPPKPLNVARMPLSSINKDAF